MLWNQTRKMLVVRGALVDQWRIAEMFGFYRQSLHSKVTIEWLWAKDPTAVPTEPAFAAVGMLMNSGQKGEASAKLEKPDGQWPFSAAVEANNVPDDGIFGIPISAKWKGPGVGGIQHGSLERLAAEEGIDPRVVSLATYRDEADVQHDLDKLESRGVVLGFHSLKHGCWWLYRVIRETGWGADRLVTGGLVTGGMAP